MCLPKAGVSVGLSRLWHGERARRVQADTVPDLANPSGGYRILETLISPFLPHAIGGPPADR